MDTKKKLIIFLVVFCASPVFASADPLYQLPQDAGEGNSYGHASGDIGRQYLGNEMQGTITGIYIQGWSLGGTVDARAVITCFTDAAYSMPCASATSTAAEISNTGIANNGAGGQGGWAGGAITAYTMTAGNYYRLYVTHSSGSGFKWGIRTSITGVPAAWVDAFTCSGCTVFGSTARVLSFRLDTPGGEYVAGAEPASGQAYADHSVAHFKGVYSRSCTVSQYTSIHFRFSFSTGTTTNAYVPVTSCGPTEYDYLFSGSYLPYAGEYTYQARLVSASPTLTSNPIATAFTASTTFSIISPPTQQSGGTLGQSVLDDSLLYNPAFQGVLDETNATSTLSGLQSGFSAVDIILNKFPINWLVSAGQVLGDLRTQTSTTSLPGMTIDFGFLSTTQALATTTENDINWTVEFLNPEIFQEVSEIPAMGIARTIASGILWVILVMFAISKARKLFARPSGG